MQPEQYYQAAGLAAMIPGFQMAIDALQAKLEELRTQLTELQSSTHVRQSKNAQHTVRHLINATRKPNWPTDPEERKAEMKRRMAKRNAKKGHGHPRNPDHPGNAAWKRKMRSSRKAQWAGLSPEDRQARLAKMQAGKAGKKAA